MNMHVAPGVTEFGVGAQKSMLNNRITSLTCIHREAGIKRSAEERRKRGKKGKGIEMESEVIKNESAAYLLKK